jgi:hypothetical protein
MKYKFQVMNIENEEIYEGAMAKFKEPVCNLLPAKLKFIPSIFF